MSYFKKGGYITLGVIIVYLIVNAFSGKTPEVGCWDGYIENMTEDGVLQCIPTCTEAFAKSNSTEETIDICNEYITMGSKEWDKLEAEIAQIKLEQKKIKDRNEGFRKVRDDKVTELNEKIMKDTVAFQQEPQSP